MRELSGLEQVVDRTRGATDQRRGFFSGKFIVCHVRIVRGAEKLSSPKIKNWLDRQPADELFAVFFMSQSDHHRQSLSQGQGRKWGQLRMQFLKISEASKTSEVCFIPFVYFVSFVFRFLIIPESILRHDG
jgi:hypothetical protein